jgi:riboflavin biosynthesis pyrimidine reductase
MLREDFGMSSLMLEGGAQTIQSFLELGLVDQIVLTIKPIFFGGYRCLTGELSRPANLRDVVVVRAEGDLILHGYLDNDMKH